MKLHHYLPIAVVAHSAIGIALVRILSASGLNYSALLPISMTSGAVIAMLLYRCWYLVKT